MKTLGTLMLATLFSSCAGKPEKAVPVTGFDINRYLGTWYEIARTDNKFERNMDNVTAQYSLNENGSVKVFNSGFDHDKNDWRSATGTAKFRGDRTRGALKVSFFKPFYGGYNVVALDPEYRYALVAGNNLKYLWILSREKTIPPAIRTDYLRLATEIGYDTSVLIWVKHDRER